MSDSPETHASLLIRIRDAEDGRSWTEFVDLYTPLVYGFCARRRLQDADASDVTQDVLRAIITAIRSFEYDPEKGGFRRWLMTVTRSKVNDFWARKRRDPQGSGQTAVHEMLAEQPSAEEEAAWEKEYQRHMFQWASEQIRREFKESTWDAFWRTTVDERSATEVADELGVSTGAVYIAKSRVLARLRAKIQEVEPDA